MRRMRYSTINPKWLPFRMQSLRWALFHGSNTPMNEDQSSHTIKSSWKTYSLPIWSKFNGGTSAAVCWKKSSCSFLCFPLSTQLSNSLMSRWNSLDLLDTGLRDPASMNLCPNPNSLKSFMEMARFCKKKTKKKQKRHETSYMKIIAVLTILSTTSEPSRKWKHISKVVEWNSGSWVSGRATHRSRLWSHLTAFSWPKNHSLNNLGRWKMKTKRSCIHFGLCSPNFEFWPEQKLHPSRTYISSAICGRNGFFNFNLGVQWWFILNSMQHLIFIFQLVG